MVVHHVEYHCDTSSVALVYEFFVLLPRSVILVEGEIMVRIVAPAVVPVEFLDRHQLYRIDSETLDVVESGFGSCKVL